MANINNDCVVVAYCNKVATLTRGEFLIQEHLRIRQCILIHAVDNCINRAITNVLFLLPCVVVPLKYAL